MNDQRYEWISKRAYALWEQAGCLPGHDEQHWLQAVSEREQLERTQASSDGHEVLSRKRATVPIVLPLDRQQILVVDDEPFVRYDTVDRLETAGYSTLEAANAAEAMMLLKHHLVGTIITDINMPGNMDGLNLAARVRSLWPRTKIIITSGLVRLRQQDLVPGVEFLAKPMPFERLLRLVASQH
ncbi:response regulator [Rhizobium sp. S152]|uniref:response regulator n=1 Tax=Rhizobium sp. S152 TaxID=3055038 RepID=UPI0025AA2608|nr:response regulator [Rhizobium sp. S152]MDM9627890.1 response regulator [Rhizobium sp. S152]